LDSSVYLLIPPFTQLNTPYPSTSYLKGFLNTKNITSFQSDLGIEVTLKLFSKEGLTTIFNSCPDSFDKKWNDLSVNIKRIIHLKQEYLDTIDIVVSFLQGNIPTMAYQISKRNLLPEANRFNMLDDLHWAFGSMGVQDKAKHIATLYLEDLSDLIKECIDVHFGFSRYAEKLGRSANSFDELHLALQNEYSLVDKILIDLLDQNLKTVKPQLVAISVPFPGNLFAAFRCAQFIKKYFPHIKVAMGGGFANTELRSLKDIRVFEYFDFITLDDGELPVENLYLYINNKLKIENLKRTYLLVDGEIQYVNSSEFKDYKQAQVGTPDYSGLFLDRYIQAIEIVNPMHSLWSNGRWNKLTMAHGCYWGKCTFCDVSLDYIKSYEPLTASILCDRMEELIRNTGETGFHFVDEAAPPSLMGALAIEIIKRKLRVSWWTNVRFEKAFTKDLCLLLKESGCIGVSGGLEVASNRLLELINKGITVEQVAKVNQNFTEAGIMVHAYLMYGFPTQTAQETIDSLEMVRQMFKAGILKSGFWHLFTMTTHSPVGLNPEKFKVKKAKDTVITFADNDVEHIDETGTDHESFSYGLKKSLFNFMQEIGLDEPLHKWFEMKIPKTSIIPDYIENILSEDNFKEYKPSTKLIYLGVPPQIEIITKSKKGNHWELASITFENKKSTTNIKVPKEQGEWLYEIIQLVSIHNPKRYTIQEVQYHYNKKGLEDFELFWDNKPINQLYKVGLLMI
jgi:hypothetical protein